MIAIGAIVAFFLAAQSLFRIAYYGDILPNTYYLKLTGYPVIPRLARGLFMAILFLFPLVPFMLLMPRLFRDARREVALLAIPLFGQLLYSVYVGGDAWEWWGGCNRYVAVAMPLFMILAARSIGLACRYRSGQAAIIAFAAATVWAHSR